MRNWFIEELTRLAEKDPKVLLVTGDLGYGVLDDFEKQFPNQFLNLGITEQSSISICAGLASQGFIPFFYSIANFPTFRCLEQIRNDVCYMRLPVVIVAVGAGYAYSKHGYTHHAIEDISIMRPLMGESVFAPHSQDSVRNVLKTIYGARKPSYLRLGNLSSSNVDEDIVHKFPISPLSSKKILLLSFGSIAPRAWQLHKILVANGIQVELQFLDNLSVSLLDKNIVEHSFDFLVTLEDHVLAGGFGSWVLENLFNKRTTPERVIRLGITKKVTIAANSQNYLWDESGLSLSECITKIMSQAAL